jgi:hypothetical protein
MESPLCLLHLAKEQKWVSFQTAESCKGQEADTLVYVREPTIEEKAAVEPCLIPDYDLQVFYLSDLTGTPIEITNQDV